MSSQYAEKVRMEFTKLQKHIVGRIKTHQLHV